jgi:hypothetical protein
LSFDPLGYSTPPLKKHDTVDMYYILAQQVRYMSKFKVARTWTPVLCLVTPQTVRMLTLFYSADVGGRKQTGSAIHTSTVVTF